MKRFIKYFLITLICLYGSGKLLDYEAEQTVQQLYARNENNIILSATPTEIKNGHQHALVLLHGFANSPSIYHSLINDARSSKKLDIYAPLLPFHGKNLQTLSNASNKAILQFTENYLQQLSNRYQRITVVAFSYSGALLVRLLQLDKLPDNIKIILYAPGIFIKLNNTTNRVKIKLYKLWRNYCNYPFLNCHFPSDSGDEQAKPFLAREENLRYRIMSATLMAFNLDLTVRPYFKQMKTPYYLYIAKDDNRVDAAKLIEICGTHAHCKAKIFESGKHLLLQSKFKKEFNKLIIKSAS